MKNFFLAGCVVILALSSCEKKSERRIRPNYVQEAEHLHRYLDSANVKPQYFKVSSTAKSQITGEKGIYLRIDPECLETENGKPLGPTIAVTLRELNAEREFVFSDAQTKASNGGPILTSAMYFIEMSSGGNMLRIKPGKRLLVDFRQFSTKRMELFTANRDSLQNLVWVPSNQRLKRTDNTQILNKDDAYYLTMPISRFGWVSSSVFNRAGASTSTTLVFDVKDINKYTFGKAFLVIPSNGTTSVMQSTMFFNGKDDMMFEHVPLEGTALLVCTAVNKGKFYAYASKIDLEKPEIAPIELLETNPKQFSELLRSLK